MEPAVLAGLPDALRRAQACSTAPAACTPPPCSTAGGESRVREDVGRHNAVDKVIGEQLLAARLPLSERILLVSGRASFEIVQKAAVAGMPIICAVSAPSSLAVDAARRFGMTLVGFLRDARFNVYTRRERIAG